VYVWVLDHRNGTGVSHPSPILVSKFFLSFFLLVNGACHLSLAFSFSFFLCINITNFGGRGRRGGGGGDSERSIDPDVCGCWNRKIERKSVTRYHILGF